MDEKDYEKVIEEQKQTIEQLTKELESCKKEIRHLKYDLIDYKKVMKKAADVLEPISHEINDLAEKTHNVYYHEISWFDLSERTINIFGRLGFRYVEQILDKYDTREQLLALPKVGEKTVEELIQELESMDYDMSKYKK